MFIVLESELDDYIDQYGILPVIVKSAPCEELRWHWCFWGPEYPVMLTGYGIYSEGDVKPQPIWSSDEKGKELIRQARYIPGW